MNIRFKLVPEAVSSERVDSKDAILKRLAQRFAEVYDLDIAALEPLGIGPTVEQVATPLAEKPTDTYSMAFSPRHL